MAANLDPWETLGIGPGASKAEIRRAYRRLARRYHPDLNPGDPDAAERFKEVQLAYETLTGRQNRPASPLDPSQTGGAPRHPPFSADEDPFLAILAAYFRQHRSGDQ